MKCLPKAGTFVETKDGYGTVEQIDLLRSTAKVRLDTDSDDKLRVYKSNELCAVPGGRPPEGEKPAHVLQYTPEKEQNDEEEAPKWEARLIVSPEEQEMAEIKTNAKSETSGQAQREGNREERHGRSGRSYRKRKKYRHRSGGKSKEQQS